MTSSIDTSAEQQKEIWETSLVMWGALLVCAALMGVIFYGGLELMITWWLTREEYGHGIIIPLITAFLIWQKRDQLEYIKFTGSWVGVAIVILGLFTYFLGEMASIYTIIQYAFLITLFGLILSLMGYRSFRIILVPLIILVFMLPLPNFLFNDLSAKLQLLSSQLGVEVIRLCDISVYLEGNVIDLGNYKLQVVEACSGLNYLFPLMTLGFIAAYFFTGALWKKAIIFLSTIPITIFMNSFRIGAIGVMVEYWGSEMADGFLHDFEGWAVFMSCITILILEMWMLAKIGEHKLLLREAFGIKFPEPTPKDAIINYRTLPKMFIVSILILVIAVFSALLLSKRSETIPDRKTFAEFPEKIGRWIGRSDIIEQIYLDKLKLSDYAMLNYRNEDGVGINFYSAYYASQRKESTTHSPSSCIPGGGWQIQNMDQISIDNAKGLLTPLRVNRLVIEKDGVKQLVYYWFKQRERNITNEQMIKWYFFVDSMTKNRTDGALIRLTTVVPNGDSLEKANKRLNDFMLNVTPIISQYVPD